MHREKYSLNYKTKFQISIFSWNLWVLCLNEQLFEFLHTLDVKLREKRKKEKKTKLTTQESFLLKDTTAFSYRSNRSKRGASHLETNWENINVTTNENRLNYFMKDNLDMMWSERGLYQSHTSCFVITWNSSLSSNETNGNLKYKSVHSLLKYTYIAMNYATKCRP